MNVKKAIELLEKGCFITHQEQDEIAKLLRKFEMIDDPESEAWDELEAKLNKQNKEKPMTNREALQIAFNALVEIDRQTPYPIAKHAIKVINKAFNEQPEQGCGECGVKAIDGYALYCVTCVEPFFKKEQT